jgi:hypothetical protein
METDRGKQRQWTYLRERMERIYDRAGYLLLMVGVLFVLFVTFYSDDWLQTLWRGVLIIMTRGRSDPAA